jgi:GT2 family glycosyltransferase
MTMPSVDVVIRCYNYGRYLRQCVGSVLSQEGVDVRVEEALVVRGDVASVDGVAAPGDAPVAYGDGGGHLRRVVRGGVVNAEQ